VSQTKSKELLDGSISKNLLNMSIPTMLGFLFQSIYDLIDIAWLGRISDSAVAGVTIFATVFWLVEILNEIIGTSSISLISQSYGNGDEERTKLCIEQTLTFKAIVAIIASIIMLIILNPLIHFFTNDKEVIKAALDFGYLRIFFLPIMFSSYTVNTALRCLGDAKRPMIFMAIAAVLNIFLDPIFIFKTIPGTNLPGLNLGVFGAGLATVLSISFAFALGFYLLMSGKTKAKPSLKGLFKLNKEIDYKLITIGLPTGLEMLFRNLSGIVGLKLIATYGTIALATMGIGNRLFGFAFMPLVGFAMGSSAIVGQCLGADDIDRSKKTAHEAAFINLTLMIIVTFVVFLFPEAIMKFFIKSPDVIKAGIPMLRIAAPGLIFAGVFMGLGSVFSGSGYTIPFMISSVAARWVVQIPIMFIVVKILNLPMVYIWFSFLFADFVEFIVMFYYYRKGTWKTKRV
jgi:putative MATE family efflux protein